ncbi:hypothetical protein GUITHDRAFT_149976 [Guillardia theta CCMP2712]|uniref:Uncharacterized protein n=1 Tax=Guillardia theta (strain CCMP2712) TaxID=905079 RepID=L1K1T8_GUITC|nr:hypothetical protein GUITHDRAFT_149976 [Guillardia theta CCMP2712]EKX54318.1 hypothetical protein GUITHDRAFT_149976 [Guillardia theta CCMP2712]|eukprot:XP_005841298.1 hypothetical protein GUITHDRAFT_149976 [Guillardia theta CCMP2712]
MPEEICLALEMGWIDRRNVKYDLRSRSDSASPSNEKEDATNDAKMTTISIPFLPPQDSYSIELHAGFLDDFLRDVNNQRRYRIFKDLWEKGSGSKFGADFLLYPECCDVMRLRCYVNVYDRPI